MNIQQALVAKDQMTKQALYDLLPNNDDTMKLIDKAFEKGNASWLQQLQCIFEEREIYSFFSILRDDLTDMKEAVESSRYGQTA